MPVGTLTLMDRIAECVAREYEPENIAPDEPPENAELLGLLPRRLQHLSNLGVELALDVARAEAALAQAELLRGVVEDLLDVELRTTFGSLRRFSRILADTQWRAYGVPMCEAEEKAENAEAVIDDIFERVHSLVLGCER